jgi:ketosteroid isomerase-like protein
MRRIPSVVFAFVLFLPLTAQAQEWTPEQQELWAWESACWETRDLETIMSCFHEDFVGWGIGNPKPTTKAERRPTFAESFETTESVSLDLQPLEIKIHGNTAVLVYLATTVTRNKETGVETRAVEKWTDVAMREGGRWVWIADHGNVVEGG